MKKNLRVPPPPLGVGPTEEIILLLLLLSVQPIQAQQLLELTNFIGKNHYIVH